MKREFDITLSINDIADAFCDLDSSRQVDVLVAVALKFRTWGAYGRDMQNINIAHEVREAGGPVAEMIKVWASAPEQTSNTTETK